MSLWEGMLCPCMLQGKSSRDIFLHMVIPDHIPQFTIPSLDKKRRHSLEEKRIHKKHRHSGKGKGQPSGTAWRSSWDPAVEDEHDAPSSSLSCSNTWLAATAQAIPDPTAWAALSLPHLSKVTTLYGFVTLGQSPQVTSEEALFFHSGSGYPRGPAAEICPSSQEELGCCRRPGMPVAGGGVCSRMGGGLRDRKQPSPHATSHKDSGGSQAYRTPAGLLLPRRCASLLRDIQVMDVLESKEAEKRERRLPGSGLSEERGLSEEQLQPGAPCWDAQEEFAPEDPQETPCPLSAAEAYEFHSPLILQSSSEKQRLPKDLWKRDSDSEMPQTARQPGSNTRASDMSLYLEEKR